MEKNILSNALEANLKQTQVMNIAIPEKQKWFGDLSKEKWGIHKRTQSFLKELNHKYCNMDDTLAGIHEICVNDLWFYNSLENNEDALMVLVDILTELFKRESNEEQYALLLQCTVKLIDRLSKEITFPPLVIDRALSLLEEEYEKHAEEFVKQSRYFKTYFNLIAKNEHFASRVFRFTQRLLKETYDYWRATITIESWYEDKRHLFQCTADEKIKSLGSSFISELYRRLDKANDWDEIYQCFFFNDIANFYRQSTERFDSYLESIFYLYYLLKIPGMSTQKTHLLYDINRNLRQVFTELEGENVLHFIEDIFRELSLLRQSNPSIVLECMLTLGKEVLALENPLATRTFVSEMLKIPFEKPGELQLDKHWQTKVNPSHIKNIRVWIELISKDPIEFRELIQALILQLKIGGIFISDTDLFQRDVTQLLNSNILPVYREMKQLAKIFPVYFKEIGAEGKLREYSTLIDEMSMRKDRLIHFLRKQIHTESNNTHIQLTKSIIQYWIDGNQEKILPLLPEDVRVFVQNDVDFFNEVHDVAVALRDKYGSQAESILNRGEKEILQTIEHIEKASPESRKKVKLLFQVYFLVLEKYSLASEDIIKLLNQNTSINLEWVQALEKNIASENYMASIHAAYTIMDALKKVVTSPEKSEGFESVYYKRHVAVGIPSMYGQYSEPKFEALGLIYRLEKFVMQLLEKQRRKLNLSYITGKTLKDIYEIMVVFQKGLSLDGIENEGFNSRLKMLSYSLSSPSFSLDQYMNIFQFMAKDIKQIIDEYFLMVFTRPIKKIASQYGACDETSVHILGEKFFRDHLQTTFLIQDLDDFIGEVIRQMTYLSEEFSKPLIQSMMTYNPDLAIATLSEENLMVDNPVFIGAKSFFLKKLKTLNFKVPEGFVLTSEVFRHHQVIKNHQGMRKELSRWIKDEIANLEEKTGKKFGDPENPLFLSVRSGSSISLPGAMQTFLNVGINDTIALGFANQNKREWTSYDCYRRFLQSWGMSHGIERDAFEDIMEEEKKKHEVSYKIDFTGEQMQALTFRYKNLLCSRGIQSLDDPYEQLEEAIFSVMDSWSSDSAKSYRSHMGIADEWGTAVLVQEMVLGNLSHFSGTGVVFTNSPMTDFSGLNLHGDFAICSQGEDIVSGLIHTLPITLDQQKRLGIEEGITLESHFPEIYAELLDKAKELVEVHGFVHQEIEFTFESGKKDDFYILQTRNQKVKKKKQRFKFKALSDGLALTKGIAVSGGAMSGRVVFDFDDIKWVKENHPHDAVVLLRPYTVPDDIPLIFKCDAVVTAKGGMTSHAAVTAASIGKGCIVDVRELIIDDDQKKATVKEKIFETGDYISLDCQRGTLHLGQLAIEEVF